MFRCYKPTETEMFLCDIYQAFGISYAHELDINLIATMFGADIFYYEGRAYTEWDDQGAVILLRKGGCNKENRSDFFHELCHIVQHEGRQDDLPSYFVELQEIQAAQFQMVAAMPYQLFPPPTTTWQEYIGVLSETFNVTEELAERRVQHIMCRMPIHYYTLEEIA